MSRLGLAWAWAVVPVWDRLQVIPRDRRWRLVLLSLLIGCLVEIGQFLLLAYVAP